MNYLARICLGALYSPLFSPLPTFFSLQFPFDLRLFFSKFLSFALLPLNAYFSDRARSYSSRNFLQSVAGSAGKSFEKPALSSEAAAKKSLYLLILSVLFAFPKRKKEKKNPQHHSTAPTKFCTAPFSRRNLYLIHTDRLDIVRVI